MIKTDHRIDEYIYKAKSFAQPLLIHMRELVHKACPNVTETIKWGMPSFEYKGPLFGFAAFKAHCAAGFWKAALMKDPENILTTKQKEKSAMGNLGCIRSFMDLPTDKIMLAYLKEAMKLNEEGVRLVRKKPAKPKDVVVPVILFNALKQNRKAREVFERFSPSHKIEYIEWINEAKTEKTRERRLLKALEWMEEGKSRNWKYMKKKQFTQV